MAHLRSAGSPVSSRDLAARFLRILNADEATCHRLLDPILSTIRGVRHRPGAGWTCEAQATPADATPTVEAAAGEPAAASPAGTLLDFVALAADGAGPGGTGMPRVVTLVPVIAGETLQEEHIPSVDPDADEILAAGPPRERAGLTLHDLQALEETVGELPIVAHRVAREVDPIRRAAQSAGLAFHPAVISAARLGHLLLGLKSNHAASELAAALGAEVAGPDDCRGRARLVAQSFLRLVPLLRERGIGSVDALLEFQQMPAEPLDLSGRSFTAEDLKALPACPGVYRFIDRDGVVVYVGKAGNLRSRVGSYFTPSARGTAKGRAVLDRAHRIEYETVASELEAALLEAALLQEHRPPLNRQFEIHERPAPYGPRLNLVVVLEDAGRAVPTCTLHFLRGGHYLRRVAALAEPGAVQVQAAAEAERWSEIAATLARAYFSGEDASGPRSGADLDWQLVGSFLRRFRDEVNVLDVDESPSAEAALDRLRVLISATLGRRGRTLAR